METSTTAAPQASQVPLIPDTKKPSRASTAVVDAKATSKPRPLPAKVLETRLFALDELEEDEDNLRKDYDRDALLRLCESMIVQGQLEPIRVRLVKGKGRIIFGHRRFRAARLSKGRITHLRAEVTDDGGVVVEQQLSENDQREGLKALERSHGHQQMKAKGMSIPDIAKATATSEATVRDSLKFADLVAPVKKAWVDGRLDSEPGAGNGYSRALEFAKMPPQVQPAILVRFDDENEARAKWGKGPLSVRELRELIAKEFLLDLKAALFPIADAQLVPKAGACTTCPKRTGAQPDMFQHVKQGLDLCLEKPCNDAKNDAFIARAAKEGRKVLDEKVAKTLFREHSDHVAGFVDADVKPWIDHEQAKKPARELVEDSEVVLAQNPHTHKLVELVPVAALPKAKPAAKTGHNYVAQERRNKKLAQESGKRAAAKARELAVKKLGAGGLTFAHWRNLADELAKHYSASDIAVARGWGQGWKKNELKKLTGGALVFFCFEVMAHEDELAAAVGVDVGQLEKSAKAELVAEGAAAKKAKDAPKVKVGTGCPILGCKRPGTGKGWCAAHLQKYRMLEKAKALPADWSLGAAAGTIRDIVLPRGRAALNAKYGAKKGKA